MAKHGWLITKVFDDDDQRSVGVFGPSTTDLTPDEIKAHPDARPFRLLDDDDNLMAEGLYVGDDSEDMLSPLDDYGEGNWGCTQVQYKNEQGAWETVNG